MSPRLAFSLACLIAGLGRSPYARAFFVPLPDANVDSSSGSGSTPTRCPEPRVNDAVLTSESPPAAIKVHLFESILRDGEQGARRTLRPSQKGAVARRLEREVGATIVDGGFPAASSLDFRGVEAVCEQTDEVVVSALAHGTPSEIGLAARALRGAKGRSRIATFHRPMEISSRYANSDVSLNGNSDGGAFVKARLLRQARRAVSAASDLAPQVQYYLVYAGNRDPAFLAELAHTASFAGATHVVVADSQSTLTPTRAHRLTKRIVEAVDSERTVVAAHFHNQMGLALPNTLASIAGGARQVESCLLGVGDAGGNLSTEQFLAYCGQCNDMTGIAREEEDNDLFPLCATVDAHSLPASVSLAQDVARMMHFRIGENQPIVGERSFTCTTGIHQDNFRHLGCTSFDPSLAGRSWRIALNRHSSRKSVQVLVKEHLRSRSSSSSGNVADVGHEEDLSDVAYSYLSYQLGEVDRTSICAFCDALLQAYSVLRNGGVAICPTTVGYTLLSTRDGAKKMKSLKGRLDGKPCGILATEEVYRATFGTESPLGGGGHRGEERYVLGHLGQPHPLALASGDDSNSYLPEDAIGPNGEVGIWLHCGPVVDYLADRLWTERGDVIVATSCNLAGEGNPKSNEYNLSYVNGQIRSKVDYEVGVKHWETPQLDGEGSWLSAPIWNIGTKNFMRKGRDQAVVAKLLQCQAENAGSNQP